MSSGADRPRPRTTGTPSPSPSPARGWPLVFDGLVAARWSPDIFTEMCEGGLAGINATCAIWEGSAETIRSIGRWYQWFDGFGDVIAPVFTTADLRAAHEAGKVGVVLSFQNSSPLDDQLRLLAVYKRLGVGVIQLTYNTQNLVGCGCYEPRDSGLSEFGRDVIAEMNRLGVAIDLSHVGRRTAADAIATSEAPVAFSHVVPAAIHPHPRNRSDEELRSVAERGGMVGICAFPPFLARGAASTLDDYLAAVEYALNLCGEDCVGLGTDSMQGHGPDFFSWITRDKGDGRVLVEFPDVVPLQGLERLAKTRELIAAMERRRWRSDRIEKVAGLNWLRFLAQAWKEPENGGRQYESKAAVTEGSDDAAARPTAGEAAAPTDRQRRESGG